ncbi:RNA polymerase sigma factor [Mucilaginibacter sp. E4BP6]|uniref:RNA polymerase sigma factor n=1 Tax=Mucilaginibacter sp. E4BP6 TaxID=2723089 RepID=UPI0017BAE82B|nr:RNA polymerase sigma-70 factor (ECF subfamily) [Mucilaginibacter sp. E4BP6]
MLNLVGKYDQMLNDGAEVEDKLLLLRLKEGSSEAFDVLYEKHWQNVYAAAFKRLQNPDLAKDMTQDVFLQLWLKRAESNILNLPAYLHTSVRNMIFNWMERERKFTPVPDLLLQLKVSMDQADSAILLKEFMEAYEALILTLTPSQQVIFRMRYQQDLSTAAIAELLDISRKTVQNQLNRAVTQLRASLTLISVVLLFSHH